MNRDITIPSLAVLTMLLLTACSPSTNTDAPDAASIQEETLVTVNGKAITDYDLKYQLVKSKNSSKDDPEVNKKVLDGIIEHELNAQRALAMGLELDSADQLQIKARQAELNAMIRSKLSALYVEQELIPAAMASDDEIRKYYEENRDQLQMEYQVGRILERSEAELQPYYDEIQNGISFEEVAGRPFTGEAAKANAPWVMNYLGWHQFPPSWRGVVDKLAVGEVSGIIRGEDDRFWIVKMLDRREREGTSFENLKERLRNQLSTEALHKLRAESKESLSQAATIVYKD